MPLAEVRKLLEIYFTEHRWCPSRAFRRVPPPIRMPQNLYPLRVRTLSNAASAKYDERTIGALAQ